MGLVAAGMVWVTPYFIVDGAAPVYYYIGVVLVYAVHQVSVYSMFVAVMAFFAQVSDPAVGGTYMTLLNTLANLGGNWPSTLALWGVDSLTWRTCQGGTLDGDSCVGADAKKVNFITALIGEYFNGGIFFRYVLTEVVIVTQKSTATTSRV